MSQDLLERATKALREQGAAEPPPDRAAFMRARVLSQAKRSSKLRPQGIWQWAAVVCLGFFVSTAMAQVIRVQLPRVIEALRREPPVEEPKPKKPQPSRPAQPKAAAPVEPEATPTPEPEAAAPSSIPAPASTASAPPRTSRPVKRAKPPLSADIPVPPPSAAAPEPEPEPPSKQPTPEAKPKTPAPEPAELALFRRAQSLHLAHDPRAIEAWDAFLRAAPSSALAPEARYNRALGLVRARKFAEARRALQPFAAGAYGSYRKQEAQQLLTSLPK